MCRNERERTRAILIAFLVASASPCDAVNVAFMPGDAFFHAKLTGEALKAFGDDGITLKYSYPPGSMAFCGFAGFDRLRIEGDTSSLSANMKRAYGGLRIDTPLRVQIDANGTQTEINGFRAYPRTPAVLRVL